MKITDKSLVIEDNSRIFIYNLNKESERFDLIKVIDNVCFCEQDESREE